MSQPLLTESPEKTKQRIERCGPQPDSVRSFQGGSNPILQLQRTLGNQRVTQLIKAKRLTPEGRIIGLQPKLTVGAADDRYEQEADRVARQVVSTPDSVALASLQQTPQIEGESAQTQTLQNKPLPLAASITPFVQRQMSREEAIEEEKDQEEDKEELLQAKFLNKSAALPLQRLTAAEEVEAEPIQAKLLMQRSISPEENKDQKLKTTPPLPLAASITSFVQRQTENNEELEDNESPVQAKFLSGANSGFLQQQTVTKDEEPETIQAQSAASRANSFEAGDDVEFRLSQSKGSGSQLPEPVRAYMEPRFGLDFSHVRIHTSSNAIQMNRDIGAHAFTHGPDIYYGAGSSPTNLELTAHELTHVVQQTGGMPLQAKRSIQVNQAIDQPKEKYKCDGEADELGSQMISMRHAPSEHSVQQEATLEEKEGQPRLLTASISPFVQSKGLPEEEEESVRVEATVPIRRATLPKEKYVQTNRDGRRGMTEDFPIRLLSSPAQIIQPAVYGTLQGEGHLWLYVPFGDEIIYYSLVLDQDLIFYFENNSTLAQNIENELERIFNPAERALHETAAYLRGTAVKQVIIGGLRSLVRTGSYDFSDLDHLLQRRTSLFYSQQLLDAATQWLAPRLNVDPAEIDWNILLPELKELANEFTPVTMIDASLQDRYVMFLDMLEVEAARLGSVVGAASIAAATADGLLMGYINSYGSTLFAEDVFAYHSEKFLDEYVLLFEELQYVPDNFDLEAFRPEPDTGRIDARREEIISQFIQEEAQGRVVMYILDRWTESTQSPEEFLESLDIEDFREELIKQLASELVERAKDDPELMATLRSRAADEARFVEVAAIYNYGLAMEQRNLDLWDIFTNVPIEELSVENEAIAADPWAYYDTSATIANILHDLLLELTPDRPIEMEVLLAGMELLQTQDIPSAYAAIFLLPELLGYFNALKRALEEQENETQRALEERLDVDWDTIAEVIRNNAEHADRFIREQWIPTLKEIALERLAANRDEIQAIYDNLDFANDEFILRLTEGADEFELLAQRLEEESYESIEMDGQIITRDDVDYLYQSARFMRDEANARRDPERLEQQRAELQEALDVYDSVTADIENDEYDPLDYSAEIYQEARQRLGISEFAEFTTTSRVLTGEVTAEQNPFLAQAIVGWHWREGVERQIETGLLLGSLLILSVFGMLISGMGGLILGIIDIGIGVGMGVKQIADAEELLDMARLDIHQDIRGVNVEEAEQALHHAWIGLGVTVVLTAGPLALSRALRIRGGGIELPPVIRQWEEGLSDTTRQLLRRDPALRRRFANMSSTARRLLTHCSRLCVPPGLIDSDVARIENLVTRMERDPRGFSTADEWMLREYFYARQETIGSAIANVESTANLAQLRSLLNQAASRRALSMPVPGGPVAASGYPGTWGNIRSMRMYGHSVSIHGAERPSHELMDRATDPGRIAGCRSRRVSTDISQWYDNSFIIEAEQRATAATVVSVAPNGKTIHVLDLGHPIGRIFTEEGTIVSDLTRVRLIRYSDGRVEVTYPIR